MLLRPVAIDEAERVLKVSSGGLFVFDPTDIRQDVFEQLARSIAASRMSVLVYAPIAAAPRCYCVAVSVAASVAASVASEIVLFDVGPEALLLQRFLRTAERASVPALVFHRLASRLLRLPQGLGLEVMRIFSWDDLARSVPDLAGRAGADATSINRWLRREGIAPASRLLVCAQMARIYDAFCHGQSTLEIVTARIGLVRVRALEAQFSRIVGAPPKRAMQTLEPEQFADRLVAYLIR